MTVVDVNTGKFTGQGGNLEETVTRNNLEAAEEIVRQLRLRDVGGIVVIDFIDMVLESNRELVLRRLLECLARDRTKHQVAEVTSLGLVQMTRKRVGAGLLEAFSQQCECCNGRGVIVTLDAPAEPAHRASAGTVHRPVPAPPSHAPGNGNGKGQGNGAGNGQGRITANGRRGNGRRGRLRATPRRTRAGQPRPPPAADRQAGAARTDARPGRHAHRPTCSGPGRSARQPRRGGNGTGGRRQRRAAARAAAPRRRHRLRHRRPRRRHPGPGPGRPDGPPGHRARRGAPRRPAHGRHGHGRTRRSAAPGRAPPSPASRSRRRPGPARGRSRQPADGARAGRRSADADRGRQRPEPTPEPPATAERRGADGPGRGEPRVGRADEASGRARSERPSRPRLRSPEAGDRAGDAADAPRPSTTPPRRAPRAAPPSRGTPRPSRSSAAEARPPEADRGHAAPPTEHGRRGAASPAPSAASAETSRPAAGPSALGGCSGAVAQAPPRCDGQITPDGPGMLPGAINATSVQARQLEARASCGRGSRSCA